MSTPHASETLQPGPRFDPTSRPEITYSLFDVDNTLIPTHSLVLPSQAFLAAARQAGEQLPLGVVTARSLPKASHIINAARMRGFSILNNGAQIYDGETGAMRVERPMPIAATNDILRTLQTRNIGHALQDNGVDYWWAGVDGQGQYFGRQDMNQPFTPANRLPMPNFKVERPFFVAVHGLAADQIAEMRDISRDYQDQHIKVEEVSETIAADGSKTYDIFFADDRANKLTALSVVADLANMELATVMVTGDGPNDAGPVGAVGTGVAMGNAAEKTRAVATHIAPDLQHDGAKIALETLVPLSK